MSSDPSARETVEAALASGRENINHNHRTASASLLQVLGLMRAFVLGGLVWAALVAVTVAMSGVFG